MGRGEEKLMPGSCECKHTCKYKTSTSRNSNNARNGKRFSFLPLQFLLHLHSVCVNQVMPSKGKYKVKNIYSGYISSIHLYQHSLGGKTWIAHANLSTFLLFTLNV